MLREKRDKSIIIKTSWKQQRPRCEIMNDVLIQHLMIILTPQLQPRRTLSRSWLMKRRVRHWRPINWVKNSRWWMSGRRGWGPRCRRPRTRRSCWSSECWSWRKLRTSKDQAENSKILELRQMWLIWSTLDVHQCDTRDAHQWRSSENQHQTLV